LGTQVNFVAFVFMEPLFTFAISSKANVNCITTFTMKSIIHNSPNYILNIEKVKHVNQIG
jgi:hypothetical protein